MNASLSIGLFSRNMYFGAGNHVLRCANKCYLGYSSNKLIN